MAFGMPSKRKADGSVMSSNTDPIIGGFGGRATTTSQRTMALTPTILYAGDVELGLSTPTKRFPLTKIVADTMDPNPVRAAERRKLLQKAHQLETNRQQFNMQKAGTILSGMGDNLLNQSIQGGLLTQPLLSRGSLG